MISRLLDLTIGLVGSVVTVVTGGDYVLRAIQLRRRPVPADQSMSAGQSGPAGQSVAAGQQASAGQPVSAATS